MAVRMNIDYYKDQLPKDFAPDSRVWVYQCNRPFTMSEALEVEEMLQGFVKVWHSHGEPVRGYGNLFFGQFVVLMADESKGSVSGCSTDSSVHIIKEIERRFAVRLFDRVLLAFYVKDAVQLLPMSQLPYALENKLMTPDTLYFDNTIRNKAELEARWLKPIKDSWLEKRLRSRLAAVPGMR
ncbi:MAG: hypothetical protein Q8927_12850 [Bacteroidota bacterium]|nr:hypothetical protein [Bacteroidota bacterium]MDP4247976.1 hypothetical protein [Bacteroidota bacterium]MDP4258822.1 hypothetical protein [Bacteroidota bacterium]